MARLAGGDARGRARQPRARGARRPDPAAARGNRPARLRPRAPAGHGPRPRRRGRRRRVRVGLEPHDPAVGDRPDRPVRRGAPGGRRRRGAVAVAAEGRRWADPLRRRGGRRPPAGRSRRPHEGARAGELPPRSARPALGCPQGHGPADRGRAADARGLHLAHRPPAVRERHRALGAHARQAARGARAVADHRQRARASMGLGRLGPALAAQRGDRRGARRRGERGRAPGAPRSRARRAARPRPPRARRGRSAAGARGAHRPHRPRARGLPPRRRRHLRPSRSRRRQVGEPQRRPRPGAPAITTGCS